MALKSVFITLISATLLAWGGLSMADEYRPDEFLGLDPSRALLSPKPLGPPSKFVPIQVEAKGEGAQAKVEPEAESKPVKTTKIEIPKPEAEAAQRRIETPRAAQARVERPGVARARVERSQTAQASTEGPRVAQARAEKPRGAARTKLARRHSDPLNAQAFDTRIQVWPCNTGGICNWKR